MYRTLLATCGAENFRGLYSLKLRIFSSHFRGATRCKQRAVHCLSMKIHLSSYHFEVQQACGANRRVGEKPPKRIICLDFFNFRPIICLDFFNLATFPPIEIEFIQLNTIILRTTYHFPCIDLGELKSKSIDYLLPNSHFQTGRTSIVPYSSSTVPVSSLVKTSRREQARTFGNFFKAVTSRLNVSSDKAILYET